MYHNDIMRALMRERARDMRTEGEAARAGSVARRAREYWADRMPGPGRGRRPRPAARRGGAAPAREA
ncbi:hypothetical protein [Actinomadura sp. WMMB 499]|uniref:hypothetical protein n=1 Tax=Actinomadura sp. WMMB 499 TaxID=1219491 RepID=UPI001243FF26|nr:hypothetical protein [Actinomadura sp. WMMB 499]QFG24292.1 hypothetical protein F7P10_27335 [Actinomadura sp. WMMB 499]